MTYAQKFLLELVEKRELRSWCQANGFSHLGVYRIAVGERVPSYKMICSMVHVIAPALWIYYSDEEIPYEVKTVPQWDSSVNPTFIVKHRRDYMELVKKYDLQLSIARNIFIFYRTKLSIEQMRLFAEEADPVEFFTLEESLKEAYVPQRGDIISLATKNWIVLSDREYSEKNSAVFAVEINENGKGRAVEEGDISGKIDMLSVATLTYSRLPPIKKGSVSESVTDEISSEIQKVLGR